MNVREYHRKSYIVKKSLGYSFVADSMSLASAGMTWLALKPTAFSWEHHKMAITLFDVINSHQSSKAYMRLPISESYIVTSYLAPFSRYLELLIGRRMDGHTN